MGGHRLGKAFIHPAAVFQRPFDGAWTGEEVVPAQVVHQDRRAPACFNVTIVAGTVGNYVCQDGEGCLFLAVGAPRGRRVLEPRNAVLHICLEPTADRVFMATEGCSNGGNPMAAIREEDRQAAFGEV